MALPNLTDNSNASSSNGSGGAPFGDGKKGTEGGWFHDRKRNAVLGSLIALGLISLFILLGNPGLLIPDEDGNNDGPAGEAEATDGNQTDDAGLTNTTDVTEEPEFPTNDTSSGSVTDGQNNNNDGNGSQGGFVIITPGENETGSNGGSTAGGSSGGGGGGGGGSHGNDNDDDTNEGNSLTYSIINPPEHGTLSGFSGDDGTVTYTPNADYNGADSFTFQATDGIEQSNVATVEMTIIPINDNPVATDDVFATPEDSILNGNVLANDMDIDADTLSTTPINDLVTAHGLVTLDGEGAFTYTPEADYFGSDSFEYEMSDGNGATATGMVAITVNAVNDVPSAADDTGFTTLEAPVLLHVLDNDSDIDSNSLFVGSVGSASHGTVVITSNGKGVIYTPEEGFAGFDTFTYSASDGSATDTVTVTAEVYNAKFGHLKPPVGGGGDHEFEQGNTASVRFKLTDAEGSDLLDELIILKIQELDENNNPIGPVVNATSTDGADIGNGFKISVGFYHYNLKTSDMSIGKWALYVYLIDSDYNPPREILMEDSPIDGISTTILIK
jgi:hypothetical protein